VDLDDFHRPIDRNRDPAAPHRVAPDAVPGEVRGVPRCINELEPFGHAKQHRPAVAGEVPDLHLDVGIVPDHLQCPARDSIGDEALDPCSVPALLDDQAVCRAGVRTIYPSISEFITQAILEKFGIEGIAVEGEVPPDPIGRYFQTDQGRALLRALLREACE
jgi:hypothetical protein